MNNQPKITNKRPTFTAVDVLRQARGLPTAGYVVVTKEFAEQLENELLRLYEIEEGTADPDRVVKGLEMALNIYQTIKNEGSITADHQLIKEFENLLNL